MSVKVFEARLPRHNRKAHAIAIACNQLQSHLLKVGKAGTIIGYEVATYDQSAADYLADAGDWAIDIIYAERDT